LRSHEVTSEQAREVYPFVVQRAVITQQTGLVQVVPLKCPISTYPQGVDSPGFQPSKQAVAGSSTVVRSQASSPQVHVAEAGRRCEIEALVPFVQ
jgi:hypothetical protein